MYSIIDVLQVVLRSWDDGPSYLHIHRDVRHFVDVLQLWYFNRLLYASNGTSSLLRYLRVSNFKLGPQLLYDGLGLWILDGFLCNLICWGSLL